MDSLNSNRIPISPIKERLARRYEALSPETLAQIDELLNQDPKEYQLKAIKKSRYQPEVGDAFALCPKDNLYFWGVVVNAHLNIPVYGGNLSTVMILRDSSSSICPMQIEINDDSVLLGPMLISRKYWSSGIFYHSSDVKIVGMDKLLPYGFYERVSKKYVDEYGEALNFVPRRFEGMGIMTMSGVACDLHRELIIDKTLLNPKYS